MNVFPSRAIPLFCLLAAAGLTGCSHSVRPDANYELPPASERKEPLRVGLVVPRPEEMADKELRVRCGAGMLKAKVKVSYSDLYGRLAYQAASQRFQKVELVSDKGRDHGRFDAVLEFDPPTIGARGNCGLRYLYFYMLVPFIVPPAGEEILPTVEGAGRLLDPQGQVIAPFTVSGSPWHRYYAEEALGSGMQKALKQMTGSPEYILFRQGRRAASIEGPEKLGDAAARKGDAGRALRHYVEAGREAAEDPEAKQRILAKLFDVARLMEPAPELPAQAQRHAERGEAFVKKLENNEGYRRMAAELEKAIELAPWWADAYHNLGLAREAAGQPNEAIGAFKTYLLTRPSPDKVEAVRRKISELEVAAELSGRESPEAVGMKSMMEGFSRGLQGQQAPAASPATKKSKAK